MKKLILKGFQLHKSVLLYLASGGITTITGKTGSGKSSFIRACEWVKDNRPLGNAFIHHDMDTATVTIDDVERKKSPKVNSYRIGDAEPLKVIKTDVPEEVTEALNLSVDNIQDQHDSIFLLNKSSGFVAQKLSELADLSSANRTLQIIKGRKKTITWATKSLKDSIKNNKVRLNELKPVDSANKTLSKIEQEQASLGDLKQKHTTLQVLYKTALKRKQTLSGLPNTNALKPARQLIAESTALNKLQEQYNTLENLMADAVSYEHLVSFNPEPLLKRARSIKKAINKYNRLDDLIGKYKRIELSLFVLDQRAVHLRKKKKELIGDECPLCHQPIK